VRELSSAAVRTGQLFNSSRIVQEFTQTVAASLTMGAPGPLQPLSMALGSGSFRNQPLLVGWWLPGTPFAAHLPPSPEITAFMEASERVSYAFLFTIEWLRSGLPRYPFGFRLPHLDPHASRVTRRGFPNSLLPWALEMRREGFAARAEVYEAIAALIELDPTEFRFTLLELRRALWASHEWGMFLESERALTADDEVTLELLLNQFRAEARHANDTAGERLMNFDYALRQAVSRSEQAAGDKPNVDAFYRAFRDIDRTIEGVGSLISQYAVGKQVQTVEPARAVWISDEAQEVRIGVANMSYSPDINEIIHVASQIPALQRLARIEGIHMEMNQRTGEQINLTMVPIERGEGATPDLAAPPNSGGLVRELFR
jgi:hypothetical protein